MARCSFGHHHMIENYCGHMFNDDWKWKGVQLKMKGLAIENEKGWWLKMKRHVTKMKKTSNKKWKGQQSKVKRANNQNFKGSTTKMTRHPSNGELKFTIVVQWWLSQYIWLWLPWMFFFPSYSSFFLKGGSFIKF